MKNTAILLISCPDRKGIVAAVSGFLYQHGANIVDAAQHQDEEGKTFLMRIEWDLQEFDLQESEFSSEFSSIADEFHMEWTLNFSFIRQKVAIFASKGDHCVADLLYRRQRGEVDFEVPCIISNHATIKDLAAFYNIPFYLIETSGKAKAEEEILQLLRKHKIDLVVLARYMQILSADFINKFDYPIINIHHSFLPAFVGARPYHQAFARGVKIIGATSHYVTEKLDEGPIIEQDVIRISHRDTVDDLIQKGRDLERIVLSRAVRWHLENRILLYANKTVVFE